MSWVWYGETPTHYHINWCLFRPRTGKLLTISLKEYPRGPLFASQNKVLSFRETESQYPIILVSVCPNNPKSLCEYRTGIYKKSYYLVFRENNITRDSRQIKIGAPKFPIPLEYSRSSAESPMNTPAVFCHCTEDHHTW